VAALVAFAAGKPWEVLSEIYGTAALAWITQHDPRTLNLARVNSSPLWIGQTDTGSLFYGSTRQTIENAAIMADCDLDWIHEAAEGEYFKVKDGAITEYQTFKPRKHQPRQWLMPYETDLDYRPSNQRERESNWDKWWEQEDELAF
jgi:glucosamine 6-phosphate synthetase-like amidotransferase/phosphosugar isomerase protein